MERKRSRYLLSGMLAAALSLILSLTSPALEVYAAPKTMPDGGTFDPDYYAANNPDVVAAFGTNETLLYQHYLICGKNEGRLPYDPSDAAAAGYPLPDGTSFDPVYYAVTYPDVREAFGNNANLLYQHYLIYGQKEGRLPHAPAAHVAVSASGVTEQAAYVRLQALKLVFPEGMRWDRSLGYYTYQGFSRGWNGYECAAYAFLVNDTIFGNEHDASEIKSSDHSNFHVGDIVRYYPSGRTSEHSVIVMEITDRGIIVTEGNYNGKVHWGRLVKWEELDSGLICIWTRYRQ